MKPKRIDRLSTKADILGVEGHHGVKGQCIGEKELVTCVEVRTGDSRGIERKVHVSET